MVTFDGDEDRIDNITVYYSEKKRNKGARNIIKAMDDAELENKMKTLLEDGVVNIGDYDFTLSIPITVRKPKKKIVNPLYLALLNSEYDNRVETLTLSTEEDKDRHARKMINEEMDDAELDENIIGGWCCRY
uniref:Uncharacterized protein n=1 Tax=Marseillevirus LCMAC202 TaxID=2506606 RepID=A0A481YYA1_9VIRU|nr:MAG: hypothetical protein LCMAC202_02520 [Marseillevirus LCMAC202]